LGSAEAVRELSQSGLDPSNLRLLDAGEARWNGAGDGEHAMLMLGFESAHHPVEHDLELALAAAREHGGEPGPVRSGGGTGKEASSAWRDAFLAAPYLRDSLAQLGVLSDTFETAITWDRFEDFHARVIEAARAAVGEPSTVTCRFTHVYPDGPAPYFTVLAPTKRGAEVEQWDEIKAAVSDVLIGAGGTITHHHAVGRDHRSLVRPPAPRRVRPCAAGGEARNRSCGRDEPGRAGRPRSLGSSCP
jgi:alkyldihydroxyacetonephosphate synthase